MINVNVIYILILAIGIYNVNPLVGICIICKYACDGTARHCTQPCARHSALCTVLSLVHGTQPGAQHGTWPGALHSAWCTALSMSVHIN